MNATAPTAVPTASPVPIFSFKLDPFPTMAEVEMTMVRAALEATGNNKLHAARLLGVSRKWLYARLKEMQGDEGTS